MSNQGTTRPRRTRGQDAPDTAPVPKIKRTRGRPELYDTAWVDQVCFMAKQGATDVEMARALGISLDTFYVRMNQYPEFSEAIKAGKFSYDSRIENTLARRAAGYYQPVEKVFANGFRTTVVEYVPPDTTAQIFWLKNRRPQEWRDRRETEIIVPETPDQAQVSSTRQLALAALALISAAAAGADDEPSPAMTIDASPNPVEEDLDDNDDFGDL